MRNYSRIFKYVLTYILILEETHETNNVIEEIPTKTYALPPTFPPEGVTLG